MAGRTGPTPGPGHRRVDPSGPPHPSSRSPGEIGEPEDFAGFLAEVLAAVAANVGATWRVTAGRPGSWEADLVHQLIAGTVGYDDEYLMAHRTEPVRVPLNVAQLVDDDGPFADPPVLPLDQALDAIWIAAENDAGAGDLSDDDAEAAWQAIEAAEADLTARYRMPTPPTPRSSPLRSPKPPAP